MHRRVALAGAVLLGAALRFYPIWFGIPYPNARPDETTVLGHAVGILGGDPNPHFFNWPSLTFYVLAGVFRAAAIVSSPLRPLDYTLLARGCMALAGTATILVLFRLAARVADVRTATVASLLLAVAVLHVRESHFAMTDTLMTLFATACLALVADAGATGEFTTFALAGLAGGLATSTKYSAAPLLLVVFAVPAGWRMRLLFASVFGAAFVAATPYSVLDFPNFRADVAFERAHLAAGHTGVDLGSGWLYHLTRSLPYGLGVPIFIASLAGIVALWRHGRAAQALALFATVFYLAIGSGRTVFFRYILPLVPLACLSAAAGIVALADWLTARPVAAPKKGTAPFICEKRGLSPFLVLVLLTLAVAALPLANSMRMDILLARTDTRVLAAEWLRPRLHPADTLHDSGSDYTRLDLAGAAFHEWRYDKASGRFVNAGERRPDWIVRYDYAAPLSHYTETDPALRALTETSYTLAYEVIGMRDGADAGFDREDAFFLPIAGFRGVERPGPNVRIYRRSEATARGGR